MIDELETLELELGAEAGEGTLSEEPLSDEGMAADETPTPDEEPDGVSAPSGEAAEEMQPDTETIPEPVEVISVDELLERLANTAHPEEEDGESEKEPEDFPEEPELEKEAPPTMELIGGPVIVQGMEDAAASLESLQDTIHPALTTPFSEYTVTEALLLLLLLAAFLSACFKLLRGAFSWLKS